MSELFEIYQENIKTVFGKLTRILNSLSTLSTDKVEIGISEAETCIKEAERLVNI